MKKWLLTSAVAVFFAQDAAVQADQQSISLGYAQGKVEHFKNIRGINAKYRYEWDNTNFGVIGSFTYLQGSDNEQYNDARDIIEAHDKVKYYSFSAGPAYRINEYVSLYGLVGLNYSKINANGTWYNYEGPKGYSAYDLSSSSHHTNFVYGAGVQFNPIDNVVIDLGYEGTRIGTSDDHAQVNGFNIGVGYRF